MSIGAHWPDLVSGSGLGVLGGWLVSNVLMRWAPKVWLWLKQPLNRARAGAVLDVLTGAPDAPAGHTCPAADDGLPAREVERLVQQAVRPLSDMVVQLHAELRAARAEVAESRAEVAALRGLIAAHGIAAPEF